MKISLRTSLLTLPLVLALTGCAGLESLERPDQWSASKEKRANALFKELCATQARENIYQVAYGVDGYLWNSPWAPIGEIWSPTHLSQVRDPNLFAPADYCAACLTGAFLNGGPHGYPYVESSFPDGRLDRNDLPANPTRDSLVHSAIYKPSSRYVISITDVSTPEMRSLWVGGSHLQVHDNTTGTLLGERISFVRGNPGLINTSYATGPWANTIRCPKDDIYSVSFTLKVLQPKPH